MYRKVSLSSFHNGKVEYCAIFGSGDIEENASVTFFYSDFTILRDIIELLLLCLKILYYKISICSYYAKRYCFTK